MGLKYIEPLKSFVLFILVFLSVWLTFTIWSYKPNYTTLNATESLEISVDEKHKTVNMSSVIEPYRILVHDGSWKGSTKSDDIDVVLKEVSSWQLTDVAQVSNNLTFEKLRNVLNEDHLFVLQFDSELPMEVFQSILPVSNKKTPELSFDYAIVNYDKLENGQSNSKELTAYFANVEQNQLYRAKIRVPDITNFKENVLKKFQAYATYVAMERETSSTLFVPEDHIEIKQKKYLLEKVNIDGFKNALFSDPKIVKNSVDESAGLEQYTDDRSLMTIDNYTYTLNYVNTTIDENKENISKAKLILNTFELINEHNGFTGDYRYSDVDYSNQKVDYQLYVGNLPVLASDENSTTKIEMYLSNGRILRYIRPAYKLSSIPFTDNTPTSTKTLESGEKMAMKLKEDDAIEFDKITSLRPGLTMEPTGEYMIYEFQPTWFYQIAGEWHAVNVEDAVAGGETDGLE